MKRLFVDSDVILDLLARREPFFAEATELFSLLQERKVKGFTSPLVFANLFYLLNREHPRASALAALRKLRLLLDVLPMDQGSVDGALASEFKDFEDALQHQCAIHAVDALITRNKRDYRHAGLPVLSPTEYLAGRGRDG